MIFEIKSVVCIVGPGHMEGSSITGEEELECSSVESGSVSHHSRIP